MEGETPCTNHPNSDMGSETADFEPFPEASEKVDSSTQLVSLDVLLPDDLLEKILAYLPIPSILRAGFVCKRWNKMVSSRSFLRILSSHQPQEPWYFMFTSDDAALGYAYDPTFHRWYGGLELPSIESSTWLVSSSCGLVCFMNNDSSSLSVCNPFTRVSKRVDDPPAGKLSDYTALSISVDRAYQSYTVAVVNSKQVPGDFLRWDLSIHVYDSQASSWSTSVVEVLTGWRGGDVCVICNGVLYCLMYCTGVLGNPEIRHSVIMHSLCAGSSHSSLLESSIPVPCLLTCGRLMNLGERLVMVGGIGKQDRPGIIKGIGIWELHEREWREVSRLPHRLLQRFGEVDEVFASSGANDLIYIQSYGAPTLLVFDMGQERWQWSPRCPATKRLPLQLFTGFCFEPRLEVSP